MKKNSLIAKKGKPLISASESLPELTLKVILISIILAAFLAASNAYLALKIGTTISASIPASVLALGILRFFRKSNVLESNIIQTAASAGEGVAAAIAFSLPAMILLHAWNHFPFWEVTGITALGGVLGVLFSVPLRRVMLNLQTLRFPEGTAIGNVLKASAKGSDQLRLMAQGGVVGAIIALAQTGLDLIGDQMNLWMRVGHSIFGFSLGFSPAPLAAGFIVGFEAGSSILIGFIGGWLIILPYLISQMHGVPSDHLYDFAMKVWSEKLRYVGVGIMLVGGIWTLIRLLRPVYEGLKVSFVSVGRLGKHDHGKSLRTEIDIPLKWVLIGSGVLGLCLLFLLKYLIVSFHLGSSPLAVWVIAAVALVYLFIVGFMLATVCGYFTGLIGSTNNPLSGVLILALLLIGGVFSIILPVGDAAHEGKVAALMILVTTIVATVASISNENLQDLKAGQMVGSTPWKQQFILIVGVVTSSFVAAPVFEMLFQAYGIGGVFPHPGMDPSHMLAAPQAGLMAAVALGLRSHNLPWSMIEIGAGFAVLCIIADEILRRRNLRIAVLAVGLGVYLPPQIMTPLIIGSLINLAVRMRLKKTPAAKKAEAESKNNAAVLLACGLVAGAAIMGVFLAVPFMLMGSTQALAIAPAGFAHIASFLGLCSTAAIVAWIWRVASK